MTTTREHVDGAKVWLKQFNSMPLTLGEPTHKCHDSSLEECVKAIELLECAGVCDSELSKWKESIIENGKCSIRTEDIIARIETHLPN